MVSTGECSAFTCAHHEAYPVIGDVITLFLKTVNGDWAGAWEATKKLLYDVTSAWVRIVTDIGVALLAAVRAVFTGLNSLVKYIFDQGVQLGVNLVDGLISGIRSKFGDVTAGGRVGPRKGAEGARVSPREPAAAQAVSRRPCPPSPPLPD